MQVTVKLWLNSVYVSVCCLPEINDFRLVMICLFAAFSLTIPPIRFCQRVLLWKKWKWSREDPVFLTLGKWDSQISCDIGIPFKRICLLSNLSFQVDKSTEDKKAKHIYKDERHSVQGKEGPEMPKCKGYPNPWCWGYPLSESLDLR